MEFKKYIECAATTANPNADEMMYWLGAGGELSEIGTLISNPQSTARMFTGFVFSHDGWNDDYRDELGDFLWYIAGLFRRFGTMPDYRRYEWCYNERGDVAGARARYDMLVYYLLAAMENRKKEKYHNKSVAVGVLLNQVIATVVALATTLDLTLEDIMEHNIAKLRARHGEQWSGGEYAS